MALYAVLEDSKRHSPEQIKALIEVRKAVAKAIMLSCPAEDVLHNAVEAAVANNNQSATSE
jgi:hypothetical protein